MSSRKKDLTGMRFTRLVAIRDTGKRLRGYVVWECKCDCGKTIEAISQNLLRGSTESCGCLNKELVTARETTHGMSNTKIYNVWASLMTRCYNKKSPAYKWYGARGVEVCEEWRHSFENFFKDMGDRPSENHSIDRIDNNGNYEPCNCRWASWETQADNKRGMKEFKITSPEGRDIIVNNVAKFCRNNGLNYFSIKAVMAGKIKSCRGWKVTPVSEVA